MAENLLEKKKMVENEPSFSHDEKEIGVAIGIPNLVEGLSDKMKALATENTVTSPSRAMEYFYNNFTKAELAFMAMHSLGRPSDNEKDDAYEEFPSE